MGRLHANKSSETQLLASVLAPAPSPLCIQTCKLMNPKASQWGTQTFSFSLFSLILNYFVLRSVYCDYLFISDVIIKHGIKEKKKSQNMCEWPD